MRVMVTGHLGYIGTVLVPMLMEYGHQVMGLDTDYYERCTFTGSLPGAQSVRKDIRDVREEDLQGFEAIIHLAALSNDPLGSYRPEVTMEINESASIRLARMAKRVGVERFLFASSCSNYGSAGSQLMTEEAPFNPVTPYGRSKVGVEKALSELADPDYCPTFMRASTAYGASPRLRFDLVINNLTAWAFTTGRVYLKSDGTPWRPVVHIEDISRAYVEALHAPKELVCNEAFNIGKTEENYQIKDLAEMVKSVVPGCRIEYAPGAGPDRRCYRVDCSKIGRVLKDFKPRWGARQGIRQLYEAYKKVGLTLEQFEGARYKRIAHLKMLINRGWLSEDLRWRARAKPSI